MFKFLRNIEKCLIKNCGPRPKGLKYPAPTGSNRGPDKPNECDVLADALYIAGYSCNASCEADQSLTVQLFCSCYVQMGPLQFIKQCEWEYRDTQRCPTETSQFDWECDPRVHDCPPEQYSRNVQITSSRKVENDGDDEHSDLSLNQNAPNSIDYLYENSV